MVCRWICGRPGSKTVPTWRQALAPVVPAIPAPMTATDRGVVLMVVSGDLFDWWVADGGWCCHEFTRVKL